MIRGTGVSNAVYNAAANLVTAFLGGPPELTGRIHARHPDFAGIASRRYMLAARDVTGDNEATAASLAAVLAAIARGDVPGLSPETHDAMRDILFLEETDDGRHFYKGGSLNSNPITRVLSGYWETRGTWGPAARLRLHGRDSGSRERRAGRSGSRRGRTPAPGTPRSAPGSRVAGGEELARHRGGSRVRFPGARRRPLADPDSPPPPAKTGRNGAGPTGTASPGRPDSCRAGRRAVLASSSGPTASGPGIPR